MTGRPAHMTHPKKARFLEIFRDTGNVRLSAQASGVGRRSVYRWRKADRAFKAAYELAAKDAVDLLVAEARRRAVEGVDRPVYYRGVQVGTVKEYSDTLLIFLLKGLDPQRFREKGDAPPAVQGEVHIFLPEREIDVTGEKHGLRPPDDGQ